MIRLKQRIALTFFTRIFITTCISTRKLVRLFNFFASCFLLGCVWFNSEKREKSVNARLVYKRNLCNASCLVVCQLW